MPWSLRMVLYGSIIVFLILIWFGFRYLISIKLTDMKPQWLYKSLYFLFAGCIIAYPVAGLTEFWLSGIFTRTGYPDFIIYLFWYGLVCMGTLLNWLLIHDLVLPVTKRISSKKDEAINLIFAKGFLAITLFTIIFTAAKLVWDTNRIIIEEIVYTLPETGSQIEPLTIIHVSDLHADEYTHDSKMNRYIHKINSFAPDIVLFAGDLITSGTEHIEAGARALGNIEATHGVIAVLGDHDYWTDTDLLVETLERYGVPVLQNENIWIDHNGFIIRITGVTKLYSSRVDEETLQSLLDHSQGEQFRLLTSHQATDRLIDQSRQAGIHQLLAGHTHGGQIRIRILFYPFTASRVESRFVNGNWMLDDMLLNINNGLGFTLAPVRFNAPPQISVIRVIPG